MDIIKGVLLVAFVIICVFLVLLVLVQDQDNSGMGGLLGGGNSAAFGSHSASVLTKATVLFVILFFIVTFAIAKILPNKSDSIDADLRAAAEESGVIIEDSDEVLRPSEGKWWDESAETAPAEETRSVGQNPADAVSSPAEGAVSDSAR